VLKAYAEEQFKKNGYTLNTASEIEGFLFAGKDAERTYHLTGKFDFISTAATITRCLWTRCASSSTPRPRCSAPMGFQNEKDHPEVAPSQYEINYSYA